MKEHSIILNHVTHIYNIGESASVKALDDVSLQLSTGELVAVIGHTGSGKSTLALHLDGLLAPDSGQVFFDGEDIHEKGFDKRAFRGRVGLVFQYPEYQLFEETVFEDVCFGPLKTGCDKLTAQAQAYEALELLSLPKDKFYTSPFTLSGGEKRRAAIAGVLAMDPDFLVLDEPTAGLDPRGRKELLGLIGRLKSEKGMGIVLISHSMDDVAAFADRVVVMKSGRIIMNDTPEEVFRNRKALEEAELSVPSFTDINRKLYEAGLTDCSFALSPTEVAEGIIRAYRHEGRINADSGKSTKADKAAGGAELHLPHRRDTLHGGMEEAEGQHGDDASGDEAGENIRGGATDGAKDLSSNVFGAWGMEEPGSAKTGNREGTAKSEDLRYAAKAGNRAGAADDKSGAKTGAGTGAASDRAGTAKKKGSSPLAGGMSFGRYYQAESFVHSLDPRTKLTATFWYIIALFICDSLPAFVLAAAFLAAAIYLSKVPLLMMLKSIKSIAFILLLTVVFNLFLTPGVPVATIGAINISMEGIRSAAVLAVRLVLLLLGASLMTYTTTPNSLTDGMEVLLRPLRVFRVPVHEIAMMMSIALRFIPILADETEKIMRAQMARGADFETGSFLKRAKAMIPLLVPLFVSAFRRAADLAMAMEARCYTGGDGRTKLNPLRYERRDHIVYICLLLMLLAVIGMAVISGKR